MYSTALFGFALVTSLLGSAYAAPSVSDIVGQLRLAPTANDRLALLKDEDVSIFYPRDFSPI